VPKKEKPQQTKQVAGEIVDAEDNVIGGGFESFQEILDALPEFLKEKNLKDKSGRRPDDPQYDPCTLYIPQHEWKGFTPGMT
jgi:hypothetical protein